MPGCGPCRLPGAQGTVMRFSPGGRERGRGGAMGPVNCHDTSCVPSPCSDNRNKDSEYSLRLLQGYLLEMQSLKPIPDLLDQVL